MNPQAQLFSEWVRTRAAMAQPPWYRVWANWFLIFTFLLIILLAGLFLSSLPTLYAGEGGGPRDIPFPRTQRAMA